MDTGANIPDKEDPHEIFAELVARLQLVSQSSRDVPEINSSFEISINQVLSLANDIGLDTQKVRKRSMERLNDYREESSSDISIQEFGMENLISVLGTDPQGGS